MPLTSEAKKKLEALRGVFQKCQSYYQKQGNGTAEARALFILSLDRKQHPKEVEEGFCYNALQAIDSGKFDLSGSPCLKVTEALRHATKLCMDASPFDETFIQYVKNEGLIGAAVLDVDFETEKAYVYLDGLIGDSYCHEWPFDQEPSYLEDSMNLLEQFHDQFTNFPRQSAPKSYWTKQSDYSVCHYLETAIQADLYAFLRGRFSTSFGINTYSESATEFGRCDITITYTDQSGAVRMVAIELKALRERTRASAKSKNTTKYSDTQNREALKKGFRQATGYESDRRILKSILAVWNARPQKHLNWKSELESQIKCDNVGLGWYHMCRTEEEWREENLPTPKLSTK